MKNSNHNYRRLFPLFALVLLLAAPGGMQAAPPDFPLPDGWSAISTGSPMSLSDTNSAGQPQRFYRLEAANP